MTAHPSSRVLTAIPDYTRTATICCTWPGCRRAVLITGQPDDAYVHHELATGYGWTIIGGDWTCPADRDAATTAAA